MKKKKPKIVRSVEGRFLPGFSPNPKGAPKKADTNIGRLEAAIARVQEKNGKNILDHFITMAFKDKFVLVALMKKLIPDLKAISVEGTLSAGMDSETAKLLRKTFQKRFEAIKKLHAHENPS